MQVRFLILRLSSIGDIVLTTPVVRCLKQQVEGAEVHYLVKKQYSCIVEHNPFIDKVHTFDDDLKSLIEILSAENFDYIIDLHKNIRSNLIKKRLKLVSFSFPKLNYKKWLLVHFGINRLPDIHIVDRYFEAVKLFDVKNDDKGLDYFINEPDEAVINDLPEKFKSGYIGFAIGGLHFTKKLPPEKLVSICKKTGLPIVILGDQNDAETAEIIRNQAGDNIFNACGRFSINRSASLVKHAKAIITHDTGLMHIAAAFKKNIISIWGNTTPQFGMYPYLPGDRSEIIEVEGLKCRPCTKIGFSKCPKKHFRCMNDIDEDKIVSIALMLFS
jgi:ADP-heptose:LPS heptosyltransferase